MPKSQGKEQISNKNTKKLKKERSVDKAKTEIVNQIIEQIKGILENPTEEGTPQTDLRKPSRKYFSQYWTNLKI